jgi:hypothetical protein
MQIGTETTEDLSGIRPVKRIFNKFIESNSGTFTIKDIQLVETMPHKTCLGRV